MLLANACNRELTALMHRSGAVIAIHSGAVIAISGFDDVNFRDFSKISDLNGKHDVILSFFRLIGQKR